MGEAYVMLAVMLLDDGAVRAAARIVENKAVCEEAAINQYDKFFLEPNIAKFYVICMPPQEVFSFLKTSTCKRTSTVKGNNYYTCGKFNADPAEKEIHRLTEEVRNK